MDRFDCQPCQGASELGGGGPVGRLHRVDAEDAVAVGGARHRSPVLFQMPAQHRQVDRRGLAGGEPQLQQATGGVVDEHDQGAARGPRTRRGASRRSGSVRQSAPAARAIETPARPGAAWVSRAPARPAAGAPSQSILRSGVPLGASLGLGLARSPGSVPPAGRGSPPAAAPAAVGSTAAPSAGKPGPPPLPHGRPPPGASLAVP